MFIRQFGQMCTGHEHGHDTTETDETGFYPHSFCQRAVQIWKNSDDVSPKRILKRFEEAREAEEVKFTCEGCNSLNSLPSCPCCETEDWNLNEVMPAIHQLRQEIPDDDEGDAEKSTEQRLLRVHRNLGHPSNRLLVQVLQEAKAPESVIKIARELE